jgi:hypothetical protein
MAAEARRGYAELRKVPGNWLKISKPKKAYAGSTGQAD